VIPLAAARAGLPGWAPVELADAVVALAVAEGNLEEKGGGVRRPGHRAERTPDQERASAEIREILEAGGLGPPMLDELPDALRERDDLRALVRLLEEEGAIRQVAEGMYVSAGALDEAEARIRSELGGRSGLGPADFRGVLPVTRKHLIPLLNHFDGRGVTVRGEGGREVPTATGAG
ncbi:MAG: SelB C-terminal domain-containing protein, partial [Longimicrobiales bacterium]|nr:SelB C-terminal domain-containing protein [Longimicrobiales bacterium]